VTQQVSEYDQGKQLAVMRLTEGLNKVDESEPEVTTTTTTTEDPQVQRQREEQAQLLQAAQQKLTAGLADIRDEQVQERDSDATTTAEEMTTTVNPALAKLLAGVDSNVPLAPTQAEAPAPVTVKTTTTVTTTSQITTSTENPAVLREREHERQMAAMLQKQAVSKLTAGFTEIAREEATATTTTSTTTTTTTTINRALKVLLAGVDPSIKVPQTKDSVRTTSTTTTTTTTQSTTIGEAGRKTLAFISSGTFNLRAHQQQFAQATVQQDDSEADDDADSPKLVDYDHGAETAADFDMEGGF